MQEVEEGRLIFSFPDDWSLIKFDAPGGFATRRFKIEGTKKLDILALAPKGSLLMLEAKDFRGYRIETRHRMQGGGDDPLDLEVAQKVRDTIAVLLAAFRQGESDLAAICTHLFGGAGRAVDVVLFLEEDEARLRTALGFRERATVESKIRSLLKPYGFRCHVLRRRTMPPSSIWSVRARPVAETSA